MKVVRFARNLIKNAGTLRDAARVRNPRVLRSLALPGVRGLILEKAKRTARTRMPVDYPATFDWRYHRDHQDLSKLYSAAKRSQWDAETALDWSTDVDPHDPEKPIIRDELLPLRDIAMFHRISRREQERQKLAVVAWLLSQFLHGEQGALYAACQLTEAVEWLDGKLYGSTQVVDEGRHVEVFHRYLTTKLEKLYEINDNLYVLIDALMTDSRWDIKFLSMQIMIEGLALGAFCTLRANTGETLLQEILKLVITDEARHVHFGVLALKRYYTEELNERERREREDFAFETAVLMRNRFLVHEFYEEYYAHIMKRSEWDRVVFESEFMRYFQSTLFRRIVPNLKRIGLLTPRIRPHYEALGLLVWEHEKAAPDLGDADLLIAGAR